MNQYASNGGTVNSDEWCCSCICGLSHVCPRQNMQISSNCSTSKNGDSEGAKDRFMYTCGRDTLTVEERSLSTCYCAEPPYLTDSGRRSGAAECSTSLNAPLPDRKNTRHVFSPKICRMAVAMSTGSRMLLDIRFLEVLLPW